MANGKRWLAGAAALVVLTAAVFTQEPGKTGKDKKEVPAKPEVKKPATHKVEKKPFRVELIAKGVLEPAETAEIAYRPQPSVMPPPGPLVIAKIVAHASAVKKGDVLVAFETNRIDQMIHDLETDKRFLEANVKYAEEELPLLEKSTPLDLAAAQRDKSNADEDLKYFLEVDKAESIKQAQFMLKSAGFQVEYAKEELRQLEKMYKANDLTEETEQIILKRQRQAVERAVFWFKQTEIDTEYTLKVMLPRKEVLLNNLAVKQGLMLERAKHTFAPAVDQKRTMLGKLRHERDKATARLAGLKKDRAAMTIRAPIDGVAYYGKFAAGQWTGAGPGKLAVHTYVSNDDVFMTVVKPRPLQMRWLIEEKDAGMARPELTGTARFTFNPEWRLAAKVAKVAAAPAAPGQFEALITLDPGAANEALTPGMACTVKFVPSSKQDAIAVPAAAVFDEGDKYIVFVTLQGKHQEREVTPGRTVGGRTEILQGLQAGEEILLDRPDAAKDTSQEGGKS